MAAMLLPVPEIRMTMDFIGGDYRRAGCGARAQAAVARHESQSKMMLAQVGRASVAL